MAEQNKNAAVSNEAAVVIPELVAKLRKPFTFEGTQYTEIDLSGVAKLKATDALEIDDFIMQRRDAAGYLLPLSHPFWVYYLAFKGSELPIEAYQAMPIRSIRAVTETLNDWLNLEEAPPSDALVMLQDPFTLKGKPVTELDLSGLDDLTGMDDAAAEKVARKYPNSGRYVAVSRIRAHQAFLFELAARALNIPASELDALSLRDAVQVRSVTLNFLAG